ncbi:DMT family transporter [Shimia sp.]|uniref:DMT family transporter n=1 Tax=Shimia sp. TaxID=1954381 RepID=UPI003299A5A7
MSSTSFYALTMLIAGVGIPILAALNAALGQRLGSPLAAGVVLFVVAFSCAFIVSAASGHLPRLSTLPAAPKHLLLAGCLVAFYVLSITWIAPKFGIGNAVFFVLLGQLLSAAAIDHFGLFGAQSSPISLTRAGGIALMAAGVWMTQLA